MKRLALCLSLTLAQPLWAEDPVYSYSENDAAMNAAIAEAQTTLPLFLAHAFGPDGVSVEGALVKAGLPTVNGENELEHIWIMPFQIEPDGSFVGLLANEPAELGDLVLGDKVQFDQEQITDWSLYAPDNRLLGNYTSRVMYDLGAFGDTPFEQIFAADPVPADWQ